MNKNLLNKNQKLISNEFNKLIKNLKNKGVSLQEINSSILVQATSYFVVNFNNDDEFQAFMDKNKSHAIDFINKQRLNGVIPYKC